MGRTVPDQAGRTTGTGRADRRPGVAGSCVRRRLGRAPCRLGAGKPSATRLVCLPNFKPSQAAGLDLAFENPVDVGLGERLNVIGSEDSYRYQSPTGPVEEGHELDDRVGHAVEASLPPEPVGDRLKYFLSPTGHRGSVHASPFTASQIKRAEHRRAIGPIAGTGTPRGRAQLRFYCGFVAFNVEAESLRLVQDGFPDEPAPMTRRQRFEPVALDVASDLAMTLFLTRSRRRRWLTYCVLRKDHGRWIVVRSGRTGGGEPRTRPAVPTTQHSGPSYLSTLMTSGVPGLRWMIGRLCTGASSVHFDGRVVSVHDSGWFVLIGSGRDRGDFEILDDKREVIGFHQQRGRPPWKPETVFERLRRRRHQRRLGRPAE